MIRFILIDFSNLRFSKNCTSFTSAKCFSECFLNRNEKNRENLFLFKCFFVPLWCPKKKDIFLGH